MRKAKNQSDENAEHESRSLSTLQTFRQQCFLVLDRIIAEIRKRFDAMQTISTHFKTITPKHLTAVTVEEISLSVENLCGFYKDDFDHADLNRELTTLKAWLSTN